MSFNPSLHPLCDIESLSDNATAFSNRSKQLRRQMWWRGCKVSNSEAHGKIGQHLHAVQSPGGKGPWIISSVRTDTMAASLSVMSSEPGPNSINTC